MNKSSVNTFIKGLNQDVDKSVMTKDSYLNATNFRIVTSKGYSSGALENVKGNKIINEDLPFETGQLVCGAVRLRDYIVIFTTNNTSSTPSGGRSMIYKATIDKDTEELLTLEVLYDDSLNNSTGTLNFSIANLIKAVSLYETTTTQKVYWTDDYNLLRYADVAKNLTIDGTVYVSDNYMAPEMFELLPLFNVSKPALSDIINGHLNSGMVQYSYQLYRLNGASTAFSPVSDMIHIVNDGDFRNTTLGYGGDGESIQTGKGCKISIYNNNIGYNRLRLVRIHYANLNSIPTISVAAEIEISTNIDTIYISDIGDNVSSLTLDEFNILSTELFKAKDITIKDNRLFAANIEKDEFVVDDFDPRAIRYKYGYAVLSGNTPNLIVEHGYNSIVFTQLSDNLIGVSVPSFSTLISYSPLTVYDYVLSGSVYGQYTDIYSFTHTYTSLSTDTSIYDINYDTGTDILTFKILNTAGIYFEFPVLSFDSGGTTLLSFTYNYLSSTPTTNASVRDGANILSIDVPASDTPIDWGAAGWQYYTSTHDGINDFNDTDNDTNSEYAYKYQSDGSTLGAEGPYIKIDFETELITLDNSNSDTTFSTTVETGGSYTNFASPWKDGELSWQRDETYRLFVEWYDNRGRKSVPQWIIDLRMPSFHEDTFLDSNGNSHSPSVLSTYSSGVVYTRSLRPRVYFKSFPANAVACQIYRVKRERSDRSVVTQGLGIPTTYDGTDNYPHSIEENLQDHNGIELVKIVSPEINITKNISKQSSDYIEYVTNFSSVNKTESTTDSVNRTTFKFLTNDRVIYTSSCRSNVNDAVVIAPAVDDTSADFITIDGKLYCNYHPAAIVGPTVAEPGGKGCTGLLVSYSDAGWSAEGVDYVIVNYKSKVFGSQYGGNTYEDRSLNVSVPCSDIITDTATWYSIKYGDTFINYFDVSTILYDLSLSDITYAQSEVAYVPLESSINCDLRHDTSAQHLCYNVVNSALRQEYMGSHVFVGASTYTYNQDLDLYLYNTVYSQQPSVQYGISEMIDTPTETKFDCLIRASNFKYTGELSDSWTKFNINEEIEVSTIYGEVRALSTVNDKLMFWQEDGFGILSVNDRSLIQDNSNSQLVLGTGGILDRYDYISTSIGILSKFTLIHSDSSVYWFYDKDTSIYTFDNQLSNLTKSKGMWSWFRNNYSSDYFVHGVYDKEYNEVVYTLYSKYSDKDWLNEYDILFVTNLFPSTVYAYNPFTKLSSLLNVPNVGATSPDIAHTNNKLWLLNSAGWPPVIDEWDITTNDFLATYNRSIDYYIGSSGLHAINNTKLLSHKYNSRTSSEWYETDITNTIAVNTKLFDGIASRVISGDYIITTTNKLISLETDVISNKFYIVQYDYLTGDVEFDIDISSVFINGPYNTYPFGIFEHNNEIYIAGQTVREGGDGNGVIYHINKNAPYTMTLHDTTPYSIYGASQLANRLTTHFGDTTVYEEEVVPTSILNYTLAYNEQTEQFTSFYDFAPRFYIDLKDKYLSIYDSGGASELYLHNSNIIPRCNFYNNVFPSTLKILYNEDYPFTKVFDNVFYVSNAFDESTDVDQYNITFDQYRCYNDYQNTDWVDLVYPTNIMRRERGWTAVVPRNMIESLYTLSPNIFTPVNIDSDATKVYHERIRDKYMVLDLSFDNESGTRFVVPFMGLKYRISYR